MTYYCCDKFTYVMKENRITTIKILEKDNRFYIDWFSCGIGHFDWNPNKDLQLNYCPFCGKDLTPGLEVLFEK